MSMHKSRIVCHTGTLFLILSLVCVIAMATQLQAAATDATTSSTSSVLSEQLSEAMPPSQLLPVGTETIEFSVTTNEPAIVKADIDDTSFADMQYTLSTDNQKTHTLSIPAEVDTPYPFVIKAASIDTPDTPWDVTRTVNYRVMRQYNPSYPRTFTLWWPRWGDWDEVTAEKLSKLSMTVFNLHGYDEPDGYKPIDPAIFQKAKQLNPHLKILTQLYSTYGCDDAFCALLEEVDQDPDHPLYQQIFIRNADGTLWEYGAGQDWAHPVYNFANPETVAFLIEQNSKLWQGDVLTFDGAFMDNCWRGFAGVNDGRGADTAKFIDLDLDGQADDPKVRDTAYEYGLQDFLRGLRAEMPNAILLCNATFGSPDEKKLHDPGQPLTDREGKPYNYTDYLSGIEYEDDLVVLSYFDDYWRSFDELMSEYKQWDQANPAINIMPNKILVDGSEDDALAYNNLQSMRYSLAAALMGDGVYLHGGWGHYTYFDEYDADLGYPEEDFGAPIAEGSTVWRRNFTNGVALVNTSSDKAITVDLGRTYRALKGDQDPSVNNGQKMTEVEIPPLDGRILLREDNTTQPTPTPGVYLPMIQSVSLINADTDEPIAGYEALSGDVTLDLATLPTDNLSLRASTEPAQVGSVQFALDGEVIQTENHLPYVAAGDTNGGQDILPMALPDAGTHTVTVTPYTQPLGQGEAGPPLTLELEIPS
ncbi:MAG: putative glycoside hydrolase [Chloroflexota bacterium]